VRAVAVAGLLLAAAGCSASDPSDDASDDRSESAGAAATTESPSVPPSAFFEVDWIAVASDVEPGIVSIAVAGPNGSGEGSGVVFDEDGHVLTNHHVVAPALGGGQVQVTASDARVYAATVTGTDPATDLAVLELEESFDSLEPVEFGDSEELSVGQPVMALGNPLGLSHTVTVGIVSALDRPVTTQNTDARLGTATPVVTNAIQTDAAVNPGNSGGALVDGEGRLVGINSSIATLGAGAGGQGGSIGLGFAIPVNQAEWIAQELLEGGVDHAYLGVTSQNTVVDVGDGQRGAAAITGVVPGTPAADAGLREGEAIIEVDDESVASTPALVAQIRERPPGTAVALTVVGRDGEEREVDVEFGTRPRG
jgi:putative serine protease PepD